MASAGTIIPKAHPAQILAIGTANPPNHINQSGYPDFLFRVTKSDHLVDLKQKFVRMCENSMIKKRYFYVNEDIVKDIPALSTHDQPSLDARQKILVKEVPKLGMEAALKAIQEWGQPKSRLTHLVFCTSSCTAMPGADHELAKILDLPPSLKRYMIYHQGCFGGAASLRLAKDLAENNPNSRVLVVCSENSLCCLRAPHQDHLENLVSFAILGDGAAAVVVGADPDATERPLFRVLSAEQRTIPNSGDGMTSRIGEMGYAFYMFKSLLSYIRNNIVPYFLETIEPFGVTDYNSLFYVVHPGGNPVLNAVEEELGLTGDKLSSSRHVLSEYGNMGSPTVFFVMDEMRKRSMEEGKATTGDGREDGVLFAFGPGLTVETMMLRSVAVTS